MIRVTDKKSIPKPKKGGPHPKFPWDKLEVGDSFFAKGVKHSMFSALRSYNRTTAIKPIKITTRREGDGTRVWRIK